MSRADYLAMRMNWAQTETAVKAAVSEIQRRSKERDAVLTVEEMHKIIMMFMRSANEGLG